MASPAITASTSSKHANEFDRNANNLSKISNSLLADDSIKWEQKVAVGIRFNPNDEVLASHYLAGKSCGSTNGPIFSLIKEVDVYQHDPSDLSSLAYDFGKGKMCFFTPLNKKSESQSQVVDIGRKPGNQHMWKAKIEVQSLQKTHWSTTRTIRNRNPIQGKTQWLMKEYMVLDNQPPNQNVQHAWTLCVVYNSKRPQPKNE